MHRVVLGVLTLLVLVPALGAFDDKDKPKSAEQYPALQKEYRTLLNEYLTAQRAGKTDEAKAALEKVEKTVGQILELAQKNPKETFAADALIGLVSAGRTAPPLQKFSDQATDTLLKEHLDNPKLATLCLILGRSRAPSAEKTLRTVLEKSTNKDNQGQACFNLGKHLADRADRAREAKQPEADKLAKEAEKAFEQVIEKYAGIASGRRTLGEAAKGELYELRHLSVGMTVPEIEAEDIDGKNFKLSDYRGKVVLIDFWGHW